MLRIVLVGVLFGVGFCLSSVGVLAAEITGTADPDVKTFTIGVVEDGACRYFDNLTERVKQELQVLVAGEVDLAFEELPAFSADWVPSKVQAALNSALDNPKVDLVFVAGILAANLAGDESITLAKPVVSGFVQDPDAVGLPYNDAGYSTKKNFNFVVVPLRSSRDLDVFHKMIAFTNLGVAVDGFLLDGIKDEIAMEMGTVKKSLGCETTVLPMNYSANDFLTEVPAAVDAVYLTPALRMDGKEWRKVIDGLNARGLPTFSMMGHRDVDIGALAGLQPECVDRLARRIALNIQQIMSGLAPEKLQVPMNLEENLVINAKTAAEIGYEPAFNILIQADVLHMEALQQGNLLNLKQAVFFALENSTELSLKAAEVRSVRAASGRAMSFLLPQVNGGVQYTQIDDKTATASMGSAAENQTKAGVTVTQLLVNDAALLQYRTAGKLYLAGLDDQEASRLDIIQETSDAYIALLQARAVYSIEMNNLRLTRSNLDLAKVRREVGTAGPEEVYRWEAEASSQQAEVFQAESNVTKMQTELNRVMGARLQAQWVAQDIELKNGSYCFLDGRLDGFVSDQAKFDILEDFSIEFALQNSAVLHQLDLHIEAARLEMNQNRRRFWVPEISASFDYKHTLDEKYAVTPQATLPDDEWMVGVQAQLPLFESGGRIYDVARAKADLDQLQEQRQNTQRLIEQRVRNALSSISSSFPNIALQKESARYSELNLSVIKDKYARGVVSILDLLDAQNQSFVASRRAEIARYSYLVDLVELQRATCWFEVDKSEAAKDEWMKKLQNYAEMRNQ